MTDWRNFDRQHVWHPFTQAKTAAAPLPIVRARGSRLIADDGREYVDLISSWWVTLHGHAEPTIARAIAAQAAQMEHVMFAGITHPLAATLAARLAGLLPGMERVFF